MEDLTGMKFNRLTVVSFLYKNKTNYYWNCVCECGNNVVVQRGALKSGHAKSCGCYGKEKLIERLTTHNLCDTPTYRTWDSMIQRCTNKKHKNYYLYGEKGITVCERWFDFQNFIEDMGLRPPNLTLDRKNGSDGYYKDNCRWITVKRQANNTKTNVNITYNGKTQSLSMWAEELGIHRGTLNNRLFRSKWTVEKSFKTTVGGK